MGGKPKLLLFSHLRGSDVMTGAEKLFLLFSGARGVLPLHARRASGGGAG